MQTKIKTKVDKLINQLNTEFEYRLSSSSFPYISSIPIKKKISNEKLVRFKILNMPLFKKVSFK